MTRFDWVCLLVCGIIPLSIMVVAGLFLIPFSITLSVAVDNQHDVVYCDHQATGYVSSISEREEEKREVIISLVSPPGGCHKTIKIRYPENRTLSLNEFVTLYEECWSRCYSHSPQPYIDKLPYDGCPNYYWEPPRADNDCNVAIGWMSFIIAVAGIVFIVGAAWAMITLIVGISMVLTTPQASVEVI